MPFINYYNMSLDRKQPEKLKWKKWKEILNKTSFNQPDGYYDERVLKPGFDFWKNLVKSDIKGVDVMIPHTLVMIGPNSFGHFFYDARLRSIWKLSEIETTVSEFEKIVTEKIDPKYLSF